MMEGELIFLRSCSRVSVFRCFIKKENFYPAPAFRFLGEICFHRLLQGLYTYLHPTGSHGACLYSGGSTPDPLWPIGSSPEPCQALEGFVLSVPGIRFQTTAVKQMQGSSKRGLAHAALQMERIECLLEAMTWLWLTFAFKFVQF